MPSRRARTHAFYKNSALAREILLEKSAAAASQYNFHGDAFEDSAVVRIDLNGYSDWVRNKGIAERVRLLDSFFSTAIPKLGDAGGIFFRDEGDCIVCLFSDYFKTGATVTGIMGFLKSMASGVYGENGDFLSAKVTATWGQVAYFQKAHESGTEDWSAEGQPFVRTARLEQAIESERQIVFFEEDYDRFFGQGVLMVSRGEKYYWEVEHRNLQVAGLGLLGGWANVVSLRYIAQGRVQP